eukprot:EG_transcript_2942
MASLTNDAEIRAYLQGHGIPQFIDQFIRKVVQEQPQDFKPVLRAMLKSGQRQSGKGSTILSASDDKPTAMKSSAMSGESGPPDYCLRDPKVRPSAEQAKSKGAVTWPNTRSEILEPNLNKDYGSTVAAQFNIAAAECQVICKKIQAECEKQKAAFFDESFWYGQRSTMYPKGAPEDCTVTEPKRVMRASELYPTGQLFMGGVGSNDITQGAVGDCFFVGAVSALASAPSSLKPLERLFVFSDVKWGIYGVCFFKNGEWEWVIVDDWIAVNQEGQQIWPQYASPGTDPELWPLIIEKAYAKLHFCWDSIDGGFARQALEDLTGGLAYTLNLWKADKAEWAGSDFSKFKALVDDPYTILGCAVGMHVQDGDGAGRAGEHGAMNGLFKGHAYSVIQFVVSDGVGFIRVRNPWGNEAEWKGRYCDNSPDWDRNPQHKRNIKPEFKDDGAFWMLWDDFRVIFTDIDIARFFPYNWCVLSLVGKASKTDVCEKNTFLLRVNQPVKGLVFSLGQNDPLTSVDHVQRKNGQLSPCTVSCYKLDHEPKDMDDLKNSLGEKRGPAPARSRTVFHTSDFEPGLYCIIPKFNEAHKVGFYVRVFAPPEADVALWRMGDVRKWSTVQAKQDAAQVPVCGVPTQDPQEGAGHRGTEEAHESREVVKITGGKTPALALQCLGCGSQEEYNALLTKAFNQCDRFNCEYLNAVQAREAMQYVLSECPVVEKGFNKKWELLSKGAGTMRLGPFNQMMQEVLTEMYTFRTEVSKRKEQGNHAGGPISLLKRNSRY